MLPMPRKDRAAHFIYGAVVANSAIAVVGLLMLFQQQLFGTSFLSARVAAAVGVGASALVGFAKERVDDWLNQKELEKGRRPSHSVSSADFAWTVLGGASASLPTLFVSL